MDEEIIKKIYSCSKCRNFSKRIGGNEHEEIFSDAIEKIIVNKIQIPSNNYTTWFYTILKSCHLDNLRKQKEIQLEETIKEEIEQTNFYKEALKSFLNKNTTSSKYRFYQDLIYLSLENSKSSLCKKLKIRRADLDNYLQEAKILIKNEYNYIINN